MKKIISFFLILLFFSLFGFTSQTQDKTMVIQNGDLLYAAKEVIVKFKLNTENDFQRLKNLSTISKLFQEISIESISPIIPHKLESHKLYGIENIYSIRYSNDIDPLLLAQKLSRLSEIEYAEPRFIYKLDFTPNDPMITNQNYLSIIKAYEGWDVSKGDSSVVIGIIDTGVYWDHPDLTPNIWINVNEIPNNGIDDDNNGYIDDIRGWDFGGLNGTPDNDPREDNPYHGTHVAGIASAATNNGIGVAGVGFKCKIMAVKTAREDQKDPGSGSPYIWYGYEGIIYAADNGAKVINCSWGGSGYSQFAQDIINYATAKGALIVAAAGNSGSSGSHYPSGYKNVISVAATNSDDRKASYSNYGYTIDVCAPGTSIYNTWSNNTYAYLSGTSMASPVVAGIAGLVASKYPNYTPVQIGEKVRVACDDIYSVNNAYRYQLGKGRANIFKALMDSINESVRMLSYEVDDKSPLGNGNGILEPGEQANIKVQFKNILSPTSNLSITLTSTTSGITVTSGTINFGAKNTGEVFDNYSQPFRIQAASNISSDLNVRLILNFSDYNYSDFQVINFIANPSYVVSNNNNVSLTIGSRGNLAFNDYPTNAQGEGFKYKNSSNLLFEGALIVGTSSSKISDVARNSSGNQQNADFVMETPVRIFQPGTVADMQAFSMFNDNGAGSNKIGVKVILNSYSYSTNPFEDFVILHYKFVNTTTSPITNFYAGLFFDWDLTSSATDDVARWDSINKMGYVYNQPGTMPYYVGAALISDTTYHFRAILNPGGDGGWGIYDGFSDLEKWESISGGVVKTNAGTGDVSFVVSSGPYSINSGDTLSVAFVVLGGDNLSSLQLHLQAAKQKWNQILTSVEDNNISIFDYSLSQNYPNPFNPRTRISYSIAKKGQVELKIYDLLGKEIETLINEEKEPGVYELYFNGENLPSGIYIYRLRVNEFVSSKKMILLK